MAKERFKIRSAVNVLLLREEQVFLLRRFNTGWSDGMFTCPSGHVEEGEAATSAAVRELHEESGVVAKSSGLCLVHTMHRRGLADTFVDFFFTATEWEGEPYNAEESKCDNAQWFPLEDLPDNIVPYLRFAIENYKQKVVYSEYGWKENELA